MVGGLLGDLVANGVVMLKIQLSCKHRPRQLISKKIFGCMSTDIIYFIRFGVFSLHEVLCQQLSLSH
jgi:hypothetical protein